MSECRRVLLVEDSFAEAELVAEALALARSPGYVVEHVTRIAAAVEVLRNARFDVVVLDLGLPDAFGLEGVRALASTKADVAIVVRSALADEQLALQALERGVDDYVIKGTPGAEAQLERSLRFAIARRQVANERNWRLESLAALAGGVAHDFNNQLAVIVNCAAFVSEELAAHGRGDEVYWDAVRGDVAEIRRAAEQAAGLTRQLLAVGRREASRPRVVGLNDVLEEARERLARTLGDQLELKYEFTDGLPAVIADPAQLERVLLNLAANARDAMPGVGQLLLRTDLTTAPGGLEEPREDSTGYVRLRVTDSGHGMSEEIRARAFEPFFTTKPQGEGSGLGLATVYGIVKQAGGNVEIDSAPGGTTVTVLLPAARPAQETAPARARPKRVIAGETVLLVDDQAAIRTITRRILERGGYDVLVAAGGEEACAIERESHGSIDLLLTDVEMPQMQGAEVVQRIRAARPQIRVLYMSGYAQQVLTAEGTLEHDVSLIEKPFTEHALLTKVREVLDDSG
ncbi:MAG: response regulator [Solirubrobacteraceae bacterium]